MTCCWFTESHFWMAHANSKLCNLIFFKHVIRGYIHFFLYVFYSMPVLLGWPDTGSCSLEKSYIPILRLNERIFLAFWVCFRGFHRPLLRWFISVVSLDQNQVQDESLSGSTRAFLTRIWAGKIFLRCGHLLVAAWIWGDQREDLLRLTTFAPWDIAVAILRCTQSLAASAFQCGLATSGSPGVLQTFSAKSRPMRHTASRIKHLAGFQILESLLDDPVCIV